MRITVLLLALAVPAASAGAAPAIAFLDDGELGAAAPGIMDLSWPEGNESSARPVILQDLGATCFQYMDVAPGTHFRGPAFAGLWPDAALAKESQLKVELLADGESVAVGFVDLDIDPESAPDPTSIVPPDPNNPDGAVMQVVATAAPLILQPPTLINFGYIDMELAEGAKIELCLGLVAGDAPLAASLIMKYDGLLTPSFVYMPWWSADPAASPPQVTSIPSQPSSPYDDDDPSYEGNAPASRPPAEESPGFGLVALLGALLVAFVARRR